MRIGIPLQRRKDLSCKPSFDFAENGRSHLLFSAGKEMIQAAFAETGPFRNKCDASAFKPVLAENFGHSGQEIGSFRYPTSHLLLEGQLGYAWVICPPRPPRPQKLKNRPLAPGSG